jgi:hypothetical protein
VLKAANFSKRSGRCEAAASAASVVAISALVSNTDLNGFGTLGTYFTIVVVRRGTGGCGQI